jgi:pantoate kinase
MSDGVEAFVPGHITGFFTVDRADDPVRTGSRGCGIALSDGVSVTVTPAAETTVRLNGESIAMEAVTRVLDALRANARVTAETPLPLGSGFGVSGAMALGTALAGNAVFERALSYNELVTIAHGAEVQAGTGLGDVIGQARGGVSIRLAPGGPEYNTVDAIPACGRIEYHTLGTLSTPEIVGGETDTLSSAGERALSITVEEPTLPTFMRGARQFARETELLTAPVRDVITDVSESGGDAAMAMLGETVFALGTGLTDAGYDAESCAIHSAGGTLQA